MTKVTIKRNGVLALDGDLLVGEIDKEFNKLKGAGESIWKHAGLTKEDFIGEQVLEDGDIRVTSAKNLSGTKEMPKYLAILHVAVPSLEHLLPSERISAIAPLYHNILEKAVSMDAKSIVSFANLFFPINMHCNFLVLPFLGIQSRGVPLEEGVDIAMKAIHDFLTSNNYKEMCISQIWLFTTSDASTLATKHELYKSPIMRGKLPKDESVRSRHWECVVSRLRDSKVQSELAVVQVPCGGVMQSLSTMTFNAMAAFPNESSTDMYFGAAHEADLIMTRIGKSDIDWTSQSAYGLEICNKHLDRISRDWHNEFYRNIKYRDNKQICSFPEHQCEKGSLIPFVKKNGETVDKSDAIRWMKKRKTVIQPGIPICEIDKAFLLSPEFNEVAASQETRELESMMEVDGNDDDVNNLMDQMDEMPLIPKRTPSTAESKVKAAVEHLLSVLNCGSKRKKDWKDLTSRQKRNRVNALRVAAKAICEVIAPDAMDELWEWVTDTKGRQEDDQSMPFKKLLTQAADLYSRTDSKHHRIFILASAASLELRLIQQFFPDVTSHMHKKARQIVCNPVHSTETRIVRERFEQRKVDRLLGVLLSPLVLLIEEGEEGLLLKKTTAKAIITLLAPTQRKNLTCVDEKIAEGMNAFDELYKMVNELEQHGFIIKEYALELTRMLQHSKSYLRGDYKAHIKTFSNCPDHCAAFALSDSKDKKLAVDCSTGTHAHNHDLLCDRCELVRASIEELREALEKAVNTTADKSEREHFEVRCEEVDVCKKAIDEMKHHQMRASVSHGERANFVEQLKPGMALVTWDWAQKLEPLHARERQSDYYAKCGISYHISHALTVIDSELAQHTSVHIVGPSVPQDGCAVSLIAESFLLELKAQGITSCIVRADNAGCYRNGPLMRSLIDMQKKTGMKIEGFMFSEAQAGKSDCDRVSASVKRKIREDVASKRSKIETKENFFDVLTTGTLLNGVSIHQCSISGVENVTSQIPQITSYSSFSFEKESIRLRRHRSIGEGVLFNFNKLLPCKGAMEITKSGGYTVESGEKFWNTRSSAVAKEVSNAKTPESTVTSVSRMIPCTEESCIDEFTSFRELKKHQTRGKHTLELQRQTLHDYCAKVIATSLDTNFSIATTQLRIAIQSSVRNGSTDLKAGWALRTTSTRNANDKPARELIRSFFLKKRSAGEKCNPHDAMTYMKSQKIPGGSRPLIAPLNRLTISQIKSLINGLLKKESEEKQNIASKKKDEESADEDEDHEFETDDEAELSDLVKKSIKFRVDSDSDLDDSESHDEPPVKQGRRI